MSSGTGTAAADAEGTQKTNRGQVACVGCRKAKTRCHIQQIEDVYQSCSRCTRLKVSCVVQTPVRRRGGPKTIVAVPSVAPSSTINTQPGSAGPAASSHTIPDLSSNHSAASTSGAVFASPPSFIYPSPSTTLAELPNPLGLLAGASNDASVALPDESSTRRVEQFDAGLTDTDLEGHLPIPHLRVGRDKLRQGLALVAQNVVSSPSHDGYFSKNDNTSSKRDIGPEYDPVSNGILAQDLLPALFGHFFAEIHPLAPTLDPAICTHQYAQTHSALLLTAICLVSAQTLPGYASLTLQLQAHAEQLLDKIFTRNLCSLEIVQGLNVHCTWPRSASRLKDDQQSKWLNVAIGMVLDLRLDSIFESPSAYNVHVASRPPSPLQGAKGETDARRRMLERTFLAIFIWDRSFALATGRNWTFSDASVAKAVQKWHTSPSDAHLVDVASMRLTCSRIRTNVAQCLQTSSSEAVPKLILEAVSKEIDNWTPRLSILDIAGHNSAWKQAIVATLIHAQTKLWALALGLPYSGTDAESLQLRTACWQAALYTCEISVMHSDTLLHLPASIAIMNVYGALMLLSIYPFVSLRHEVPRNAIVGLVGQVAQYLIRSGSEPSHRNGPNAVYGRHLLAVARLHLPTTSEGVQSQVAPERSHQESSDITVDAAHQFSQHNEFAFDASFYPWPPAAATVTGLASADQDAMSAGWPLMDWFMADSPYLP